MEMKCLGLFLGLLLGFCLQDTGCVDPSEELDDAKSRGYRSSNHRESSNIEASKVSLGYCYPGPRFPRDCKEVYDLYYIGTDSRTHIIQPDNAPNPFPVYCNNSIDGGGWTVLQRRVDGSVDFYRNWNSYKQGFGVLKHEFWLGNDNIHFLTKQRKYTLRIDVVNRLGDPYHAKFDDFVINGELDKYRLSSLGTYSGTAVYDQESCIDKHRYCGANPGWPEYWCNNPQYVFVDFYCRKMCGHCRGYPGYALLYHLDEPFSTYDCDNDDWDDYNCAAGSHGAWWYRGCAESNLNGDYNAARGAATSILWGSRGSEDNIKYTSLMIRPT